MYILSKGTKGRQIAILTITIFFSIPIIIFFLFDESEYGRWLFMFSGLFVLTVNVLYSRLYNIRFDARKIIIENLYKRKAIDENEFEKITTTDKLYLGFIPLPLPSPPYFVLQLKSGKRYTFLDMSYKALFSVSALGTKYANRRTELIVDYLKK